MNEDYYRPVFYKLFGVKSTGEKRQVGDQTRDLESLKKLKLEMIRTSANAESCEDTFLIFDNNNKIVN